MWLNCFNQLLVSQFSLYRALSAMDTLRPYKRCGDKVVYRQTFFQGITRQSAVLYILLTQTIEAPKKRTIKSDKHIKRKSGKGR